MPQGNTGAVPAAQNTVEELQPASTAGAPATADSGGGSSNSSTVTDGGAKAGGALMDAASGGASNGTPVVPRAASADAALEAAGDDAHATSSGVSEAEGDEDSAADSEGTQDFSDDEDEGKDGYKKGGYHPVPAVATLLPRSLPPSLPSLALLPFLVWCSTRSDFQEDRRDRKRLTRRRRTQTEDVS